MESFFPKSLQVSHPYEFFRYFQIKFGDFLTFLKNLEIQDGAGFLKCMTSSWCDMTVIIDTGLSLKETFLNAFKHHICFIFIA